MSSDEKVLDFPRVEVTSEENARRVMVEATRLASLRAAAGRYGTPDRNLILGHLAYPKTTLYGVVFQKIEWAPCLRVSLVASGGTWRSSVWQCQRSTTAPGSSRQLLVSTKPESSNHKRSSKISTKVPDQLLLQGILASGAVFAVHIEGGKHHGTGVQIDITGDDGDLQITNTSAFGDVGEEYNLFGARVADTKMAPLAVPASYNWLPPSDLPSGVLELADLFEVHARDLASGSRTVPSFEDALFMQRLLEQAAVSSASGHRIKL